MTSPRPVNPQAKKHTDAEEKAFLKSYSAKSFNKPSVAVDLCIFTIIDGQLRVLLVKRKEFPFKGRWALPGGFLRVGDTAENQGEDLDAAAMRELTEETGLESNRVHIEQFYTFGKSGRDPRLRVVSVGYFALVRPDLAPFVKAGGDADHATWISVEEIEKHELAFDHQAIVEKAVKTVRTGLEDSNIASELVPLTFTIPELRHTHSMVLSKPMDPGNFRRKFNRMLEDGLVEQAPGKRITASKPATVYRFKK
jgi:8-oxo-dGTP diphosphatase